MPAKTKLTPKVSAAKSAAEKVKGFAAKPVANDKVMKAAPPSKPVAKEQAEKAVPVAAKKSPSAQPVQKPSAAIPAQKNATTTKTTQPRTSMAHPSKGAATAKATPKAPPVKAASPIPVQAKTAVHKAPAATTVKAAHPAMKPQVAPQAKPVVVTKVGGAVKPAAAPAISPAAIALAAAAPKAAVPRAMPAAVATATAQRISQPAAPAQSVGTPKDLALKAQQAQQALAAKKPVSARHGFKTNEWIVYPAHGVGRIVAIEEQEIAGMALELFVITFEKDKMTLRVPTGKSQSVGMRKLAEEGVVKRAMETLKGKARIKRTMWSRRAQEFEQKINSGDLVSIAEVVRDLFRAETQPEQSYSERQLYEAALDRMAREIAAVEKIDERGAVQRVTEILSKSAKSRRAEAGEPAAGDGVKAA